MEVYSRNTSTPEAERGELCVQKHSRLHAKYEFNTLYETISRGRGRKEGEKKERKIKRKRRIKKRGKG